MRETQARGNLLLKRGSGIVAWERDAVSENERDAGKLWCLELRVAQLGGGYICIAESMLYGVGDGTELVRSTIIHCTSSRRARCFYGEKWLWGTNARASIVSQIPTVSLVGRDRIEWYMTIFVLHDLVNSCPSSQEHDPSVSAKEKGKKDNTDEMRSKE